tara:strand:+ start:1840 stop:2619 length:780 start_codon:yes stop_codon:yes gene_type:complete
MAKSTDILFVPDPHSHPDHNNDRADWLGKYILATKPKIVVNIGDAADMASLSSFDKGKASFSSANYEKDINAHLDFQDRMWQPIKASKRKQPYRVVHEGNHEHRLKRVLEFDPHLAGEKFGLSFNNYQFNDYYHDVIEYEGGTPGIDEINGVLFSHFFVSGVMGRPIGGVHHAATMLNKNNQSSVQGHSHLFDYSIKKSITGKSIQGLVGGVFQDFHSGWAGNVNNLWWRGMCHLRNVDNGNFDLETIGMDALRKAYKE